MKLVFLWMVILINLSSGFSQQPDEINLTNHAAEDRYASYSPDGSLIVFESNRLGNWDVFIMDADGNNLKQLTTSPEDDRRPDWHPSGKRILFESNRKGKFSLYEININTLHLTGVTLENQDGIPTFGRYSPNGRQIACSLVKTEDESEIIIVNRRGKNHALLLNLDLEAIIQDGHQMENLLSFFQDMKRIMKMTKSISSKKTVQI